MKKNDKDDVSSVSCPYCEGATSLHVRAPDINRQVSDVIFDLYRCHACGLMFVVNPPADLGPYYTEDYHFTPESAEELEPHLPSQKFKIDLVRNISQAAD